MIRGELEGLINGLDASREDISASWVARAQADPTFGQLEGGPPEFVSKILEASRLPQGVDVGPDAEWTNSVIEWSSDRQTTIRCLSRELLYLNTALIEQLLALPSSEQQTELISRIERLTYWALECIASQLAHSLDCAAHIDSLTGLRNRAGFEKDRLRSEGRTTELAFATIDMDGLKQINDQQGHDAGDEAIKRMARNLSELSAPGTFISRWGGDEFGVIAELKPAELIRLLERVRESADIKFSFGVVGYTVGKDSWSESCAIADARMYEQKRARKKKTAGNMLQRIAKRLCVAIS